MSMRGVVRVPTARGTTVLLLSLGVAFVGFAAVGTVLAPRAGADATLGVYALIGDATGVIVYEDEPSANAHPEGQGSAPEAQSLLANGPVGYGLAAVGWPGATEGNAGGLAQILFPGPLGNLPGVPFPDAVTNFVHSNAALANYPIRAEARAGSHPDGSFAGPGVNLIAHAGDADVHSVADVQGAQQPGTASYGNMHSNSSSTLVGSVGRVTASSTVTNINIEGAVKIGSVTSTATAQTNGASSYGAGSTIVSNMTIGGQPAYVDGSGVHLGKPGSPSNPAAEQVVNQALAPFGMKVYVSQPQLQSKGASTDYTAGSLLFVWNPPGDSSKNTFVASFGGARASVTGTLGSPFGLPATPTIAAPTPAAAPPSASPVAESPPAVSPSSALAAPTSRTAPLKATPLAAPRATVTQPLTFARTFRGIGLGAILAGLVGVGLLFAGFRRLADDVLDRPPGTCPLEDAS